MLSCSFLLNTVTLSRLNWLCRFRPGINTNVSTKGNQIKLKLRLHLFKDKLHKCWFLPDFSDRGKRRARKSWIRPQNTVFWDLDSLLKRSTQIERCVTATPFKHKPSVHEGNTILTVTHPQQVVLPGSVKRVLEKARAQTVIKCYAGEIHKPAFTQTLRLIYRFPGGNILLHEGEDFVTLVQREAVQYISQQKERSCSRTDTYTKRVKQDRKSLKSLQSFAWGEKTCSNVRPHLAAKTK